ncbi:DUF3575 domain-containing protein [Flavihumibacter sp. R14]|nr:DUF3575 domain-containing protein [Flavihumibacter soli]
MQKFFTRTLLCSSLLFLLGGTTASYAQLIADSVKTGGSRNYLVKVNLLGLPLNNFSFQFERAIGGKTAVGLGIRYMAKSGIPLSGTVEGLVDDPEAWNNLQQFKTGNIAFTPEVRFYMGKSVFRGFYVAPFARYSKYSAELPVSFDVGDDAGNTVTQTLPLRGDMTTITGGLLLGAQWKLSKLVYLDWSMLGPQYGKSSGNIKGTRSLSADEQTALREELEDLDDLPILNTSSTVDNNGAKVDFKGPWAGVRSSFSIGFRF